MGIPIRGLNPGGMLPGCPGGRIPKLGYIIAMIGDCARKSLLVRILSESSFLTSPYVKSEVKESF